MLKSFSLKRRELINSIKNKQEVPVELGELITFKSNVVDFYLFILKGEVFVLQNELKEAIYNSQFKRGYLQ